MSFEERFTGKGRNGGAVFQSAEQLARLEALTKRNVDAQIQAREDEANRDFDRAKIAFAAEKTAQDQQLASDIRRKGEQASF